jgi:hypothetical protein
VPVGTKIVPVDAAEFVAGSGRDPSASPWRVIRRRV